MDAYLELVRSQEFISNVNQIELLFFCLSLLLFDLQFDLQVLNPFSILFQVIQPSTLDLFFETLHIILFSQ